MCDNTCPSSIWVLLDRQVGKIQWNIPWSHSTYGDEGSAKQALERAISDELINRRSRATWFEFNLQRYCQCNHGPV